MKIALIGYGKMGKAIEKEANIRGHKIILITNSTPNKKKLKEAEVAIEFSKPYSAYTNIKICLYASIPIVCGTTGWLKKYSYIKKICKKKKGSFLYSSNFSISVNIIFELIKKLIYLIKPYISNYNISIKEIHHIEKLDKPSGTALFFANFMIKKNIKKKWVLDKKNKKNEILIKSKRIKNILGIHTITFSSKEDFIQIKHSALNRRIFALGAVIAAEWLKNKKGIFTMSDVLKYT